jgi:hypothetical protein
VPDAGPSAEAIAARLSAAGLPTRIEEHTGHTSVAAKVPKLLSAESWREALTAVAQADRFGLISTSVSADRTLWAVVHKPVNASSDSDPDHDR